MGSLESWVGVVYASVWQEFLPGFSREIVLGSAITVQSCCFIQNKQECLYMYIYVHVYTTCTMYVSPEMIYTYTHTCIMIDLHAFAYVCHQKRIRYTHIGII